jgi:hypothetical protein
MSEALDVQVPNPHEPTLWQSFLSATLDQVTGWVTRNPDAATSRYEDFRGRMRAFRADLCRMAADIEAMPKGPARREATGIFCPLLGRYARYANLVYGGTSAARDALFPAGDVPCEIPLIKDADGQWKAVACVGAAQIPAAMVVVVAVAVCVVVWLADDMVRAATGVTQIQELRKLHESGAPAEAVIEAAKAVKEQAASPGVSGAAASAASSAASLLFGLAALAGAGFLLSQVAKSR